MLRLVQTVGLALVLAVPAAAQVPIPANERASETATSKKIPAEQASQTAKDKVAQAMARRATRVRGEAVGLDNRPVTPATPASPARGVKPATPANGGSATPARPVTPATPASPSRRPENPGSQGRRP